MKNVIVGSAAVAMLAGGWILYSARAADESKPNAQDAQAIEENTAAVPVVLKADAPAKLSIDMKDVSYAIGFRIGSDMQKQDIGMDTGQLIDGMRTAIAGGKGRMSEEQMGKMLMNFQRERMQAEQSKAKASANKALVEGEAFLTENSKAQGVVTTDTGLQYKIVRSGDGKQPKKTDKVTVHYKGQLRGGTVFDSSYQRGQPATFQADRVIPGWTEALQMMHEGDKWELFIPAKLGYGSQGARGAIGPNEVLIFDVELLSVGEQSEVSTDDAKEADAAKSEKS